MSEKYFSELEKMEHVINKNKTYCPCCNLILTKNYSKKHINTQIHKLNTTKFVIYLIDIIINHIPKPNNHDADMEIINSKYKNFIKM
jgi:hypothetical protein